MPARAPVDDEILELFRAPLSEFTSARNALASKLSKAGERDRASEVKSLRKPTAAVWAINQVAQREPHRVQSLVEAAASLREAQERVLTGEEEASALKDATRAFRDEVASFIEAAEGALSESKQRATEQVTDRIRETLLATATAGAGHVAKLQSGALDEELSPAGFGGLVAPVGFEVPARPSRARTPLAAESSPREREELEEKRRRIAEARRDKELARRDRDRAKAHAGNAHDAATQAAERAVAAEEAARQARENAREADKSARAAERDLEQAESRLARSEKALHALVPNGEV